MTTSLGTYTAKLTDGPLEGKTIATEFLSSGDPQPRIEIPVASSEKRYLYTRSGAREFSASDFDEDSGNSGRPSAVEYRFLEARFD